MSMTPFSSEEKDPTCVVKMLECLKPNQRTSYMPRPRPDIGSRRGASVATRLMFEESVAMRRPSISSNKKRVLDVGADVHFRSVEKKMKEDMSDSLVSASPWQLRLLKADLAKAKAQIQVLQNLNNGHNRLKMEQEQIHANEKMALQLQLDGSTDRIKNLESRIDVLTRRSSGAKEELMEAKTQIASYERNLGEKLRQLEKQNAELKDELSGAQLSAQKTAVSEQWRITQLEAELKTAQAATDEHQVRAVELLAKLQDANKNSANAELLENRVQELQMVIRGLEREQEDNKEALAMAKQQQHKLLAYPDMERTVERLTEDNSKLRALVANKLLLEERVSSLTVRLVGSEERDRELAQALASRDHLTQALDEWVALAKELGGAHRPAAVRHRFDQLQQQELQLTADLGQVKSRLRGAAEEKKTILTELEEKKKQAEKLTNVIELMKNAARRVNKKLMLITMERNSYRSQLDSYEKDLTMPTSAALLNSQHEQQRARIEDLEKAVEGWRELAEGEGAKQSVDATGPASDARIPQLEAEKEALQRTTEQLRRRVEELELEQQYRALKGDFNPMKSKVMHFRLNPQSEAESARSDELSLVQAECARLRERVRVLQEGNTDADANITLITDDRLRTTNSQEVLDLRNQVKSYDVKIQRLKEAFKVTTGEFREVVYMILGYRIDRNNNVYNLSSMYAESPDDVITFTYNSTHGNVELLETPFSNTLEHLIDLHLRRQQSIPVFLSAVTVDLFSQQTMNTVTEPTIF